MKAIANLFLRAKHWQMFLLLFAAPTITELFVIPATIRSWRDLGPNAFVYLGVMLLYFLCFLAWFGSMGLFFRTIVSSELRMGTQFFRFALVYPVLYVLIFFFLLIPDRVPISVVLPLHLACMVCIFYLLYFVSKNLVLAETRKQASFYEYAGPFFLLWFFPVGVWIVQPRVNRLYAEKNSTKELTATGVAKSW